MAGIINYIHGESGVVESLTIQSDDDGKKYRVLRMRDNPFRSDAIDYGSDIRIDPTLTPGDEVSFVRLDAWSGYWLRKPERYHDSLEHALSRYLSPDECASERTSGLKPSRADSPPLIEASVFLSHSSWNKLFARFVRKNLERYGRVSVWLDEEQGQTGEAESNLDQWLRNAVVEARGVVIFWSEPCRGSDWVRKEIEWAVQRSAEVPVVVVNCDGTPVPADLRSCSHVVAVEGMWYAHGLGEEVFPCLHGMETRLQWIRQNEQLGTSVKADPVSSCMTFEDISAHEGTAETDVRWSRHAGVLAWEFDLCDRRTNEVITVSGPKEIRVGERRADLAVDFGIRKGDRVARIASYRTSAFAWSSQWYGLVWMRIDVPALDLEWVHSCYHCQQLIARDLNSYDPQDIEPIDIPDWFGPDAISQSNQTVDTGTIADTVEVLLSSGVQLKQGNIDEPAKFPEEFAWLDLHKLARRCHDAGVASMKKSGLQWCPKGYREKGYNPYMAPFNHLTEQYRQNLVTRLARGIKAMLKSGVVLIPSGGK